MKDWAYVSQYHISSNFGFVFSMRFMVIPSCFTIWWRHHKDFFHLRTCWFGSLLIDLFRFRTLKHLWGGNGMSSPISPIFTLIRISWKMLRCPKFEEYWAPISHTMGVLIIQYWDYENNTGMSWHTYLIFTPDSRWTGILRNIERKKLRFPERKFFGKKVGQDNFQ